MVYLGAWGKLIHEKNQKSNISGTVPLSPAMGARTHYKRRVSVCDFYILRVVLPIFYCSKIGGPIMGIYKLLTDT